MPVLKFETKLINGRPNIVFEKERQQRSSKKRDYKTKVQKFSLRNPNNDKFDDSNNEIENVPTVRRNDNSINTETRSSNKMRQRRRSQSSTPTGNKERTNLYDSSNRRLRSVPQKESLFNFLKNEKQTAKETVNEERPADREVSAHRRQRQRSLCDEDIEEIMRQVILENKNTLSDNQLVDLLAKIYINAKGDSRAPPVVPKMSLPQTKKDINKSEKQAAIPSLELGDSDKVVVPSRNVSAEAVVPLTMAQKKQLQWDKERAELSKITSYNPWGRPGCGAPIKDPYEGATSEISGQSRSGAARFSLSANKEPPPAETPRPTGLSQAEIKRRQWLSELNEQVAEKEKMKHNPSSVPDQYDSKSSMHATGDLSPGHGRGKGLANLNQVTSEELMLKRHKQMEQQEAIKRQIEEKELNKRLEREKKALLDQQEEMRINKEKQHIDTQYISETARVKQKEDESGRRFAQLRTQVEEAERAALLDKRMKRLQHLELAGHDTRKLRAGLVADQMTGRLEASTEFLSEDNSFNKARMDKGYSEHGYQVAPRSRYTVTEDHAIQTDIEDDDEYERHNHRKVYRNRSVEAMKEDRRTPRTVINTKETKIDLKKQDKRVARVPSATYTRQEEKIKFKRPESIGSRKPWGVKKVSKKYVPQSKRDPFYSVTKNERELNKNERVNRILAQVRANMDRIPDVDVNDGHQSQRHKKCDDRRQPDHDKENIAVNHGTYDLKDQMQGGEDDRIQASVRYKDSYRQPAYPKSTRDTRTPNYEDDLWNERNHEIVRTTDVLDPSLADQKFLISRENTGRERARHSYYKSQNPGQLGDHFDKQQQQPRHYPNGQDKRDPLSYPPGHPTNRQNTILKQLSDIREDLRMRQREIETSLSLNGDL